MSKRRKKTYLILISLGGLALLADRLMSPAAISGPEAAYGGAPPVKTKADDASLLDASQTAIPELVFPRNLPATGSVSGTRDVFAPPPHVFANGGSRRSTNGQAPGAATLGAQAFRTRHQLRGVMVTGQVRIAILGQLWVRVGQSVDGCTLTHLSGEEARFACPDGETVLRVKTPIPSGN